MTDKVKEIRKALEAATPGPWKMDVVMHNNEGFEEFIKSIHIIEPNGLCVTAMNWSNPVKENAHLIANAPEWLSYLLTELDTAKQENERLTQIRYNATEAHMVIQSRQVEQIENLQQQLKQAIHPIKEAHRLLELHRTAEAHATLTAAVNTVVEQVEKENTHEK